MKSNKLINDDQSLLSVRDRWNSNLPIYDDGYGPIFIHHTSCGNFSFIDAVIRARTWEDAYSVWEDEFAPEPDPEDITEEALIKEYGEDWQDDACFQEQYGYRSNTGPGKGILYVKDLNCDTMEKLTSDKVARHELTLIIRDFEDGPDIAFVPSIPFLV